MPIVTYEIECQPEDMPFEGNCSAIDPETDRKQEEWIRDQLARGNEWAWCQIKVTAKLGGFAGYAYLGGNSYLGEEDFTINSRDYYEQLQHEALEDLIANLRHAIEDGEEAARLLISLG